MVSVIQQVQNKSLKYNLDENNARTFDTYIHSFRSLCFFFSKDELNDFIF